MFKQKLLVRKEQKFGVTLRNFPSWISKQILVRRSTGRMSISYFKETARIYSKVSVVEQVRVALSPALGLLLLTELVQSKARLAP